MAENPLPPYAADRRLLAKDHGTPPKVLEELARTDDSMTLWFVASNPSAPSEALALLALNPEWRIQKAVLGHTHTSLATLRRLAAEGPFPHPAQEALKVREQSTGVAAEGPQPETEPGSHEPTTELERAESFRLLGLPTAYEVQALDLTAGVPTSRYPRTDEGLASAQAHFWRLEGLPPPPSSDLPPAAPASPETGLPPLLSKSGRIWIAVSAIVVAAAIAGAVTISLVSQPRHPHHSPASTSLAGCGSVTLATNIYAPISMGKTFTLTAHSNCRASLQFQLSLSDPDGSTQTPSYWQWNAARKWTITASDSPGIYSYSANVRVGGRGQSFTTSSVYWTVQETPTDLTLAENDTALDSQLEYWCARGTTNCENESLTVIDAARAQEGLSGLGFPSNFWSLPEDEQTLILIDNERVSRDLAPVTGITAQLDQDALGGAQAHTDPTYPGSNADWVGNWEGGQNAGVDDFIDMYDDGYSTSPDSGNLDCVPGNTTGCWGHRDNILNNWTDDQGDAIQMGVACVPWDNDGFETLSCTTLIVDMLNPQPYTYTWADAVAAGA